MNCDKNCFECKLEDCGLTRHKNPISRKQYHHNYYLLNRDYYREKARQRYAARKAREMMEKESRCHYCDKEWDEPRDVLKYKDHYFCGEECLGAYLVEQADKEIEVVWHDTEENRRICAMEDKQDEFI